MRPATEWPGVRYGAVGIHVMLAAAACTDSRSGGRADAPRLFVDVAVDTLWTRGSLSDTVIELPLHVRADGDLLLIADGARPGVAAIRASDGATAWTVGRRGRGPIEFSRPAVVETLADGRILVADTEVARVTLLDRAGARVGEFALEDAQVTGLCALEDNSLVAVAATHGENFRRLSLDGRVLASYAVPWPELVKEPLLARQLQTATPPDRKDCVFTLTLGRGFGSFDGERFLFTNDYVERLGVPDVDVNESSSRQQRTRDQRLRNPTLSTRSAAVTRDQIYIVFQGATPEAGRIIDVYRRDGAYEYSFRLPRRVGELTWSDDTFYALSQIEGVPVISALRIRRRT
jgi:hypothetical protein